MQSKAEERFDDNLFPNAEERCRVFQGKKVVGGGKGGKGGGGGFGLC